MYDSKKHTINEICKALGISKPTLYKYLAPPLPLRATVAPKGMGGHEKNKKG
jgi:predicted DNA-binding transcriptional regulator AlpA